MGHFPEPCCEFGLGGSGLVLDGNQARSTHRCSRPPCNLDIAGGVACHSRCWTSGVDIFISQELESPQGHGAGRLFDLDQLGCVSVRRDNGQGDGSQPRLLPAANPHSIRWSDNLS